MKKLILLLLSVVGLYGQAFPPPASGGGGAAVPAAGMTKSDGTVLAKATPDVDFQSALKVNPLSYGCTANGTVDDTPCLMAMHDALFAVQAADTSDTVAFAIESPASKKYHYLNNRWMWGLKRLRIDFNGSSIQNYLSDASTPVGIEKYPLVTNGGAFYTSGISCFSPGCNINAGTAAGTLINTAHPGDTSFTTITPGDAANFTPGHWIILYSYNQSSVVPGLFPPHARYVDWVKVSTTTPPDISTGIVVIDRALSYLHSAAYPEDPGYSFSNSSPAGMARALDLTSAGIAPTERLIITGLKVLPNPNTSLSVAQQYFWVNNAINVEIRDSDIPSFDPELDKSISISKSAIGYTEPDQMVGNLTFDDDNVASNANAQGVATMTIKGGVFATPINFNPRVLDVIGVTANGAGSTAGATNRAFDFGFNNGPSRVSIRSSVLNGKNFYTDTYIGQPTIAKLVLDGSLGGTLTNNTTVVAPFSTVVSGVLSTSSLTVTGVTGASSIAIPGEMISGTGIRGGTTITAVGSNSLTLSLMPTVSSTQSLTVYLAPNWKFWGCLEKSGNVFVTTTTADGIPRAGVVQSIYGGTTGLKADFKFNSVIPANANTTLNCNTTSSLNMLGNTYNNWLLEDPASSSNVVPPYPNVSNLNIEDIISNGGRFQTYPFDTSTAGGAQVLNVFRVIKKIIIDVVQPYTGSDTTATMRFSVGAGVPATTETVNLTIPGRREISVGEIGGAQTGDTLAPLGYYYAGTVNVVQINQSGQNPLAGTQAQQALYTVMLETDNPYRSNLQ